MVGSEERLGILTNAHVVKDAVLIHVIRVGSTKLERAELVEHAVSTDLDLALLSIKVKGFWEQATPLELSPKLPSLFSDVMVVGFPSGGKQVCVTKGVVSRVTTQLFAVDGFPSPSQLAVQIDAAINPGNSGGPALNPVGNTCYGVAAMKMSSVGADNIGYIIPSLTVLTFLSDIYEHGKFCGVIDPGFHYANIENETLRKRHQLPPNGPDGVLVTGVKSFSHAANQLEVGDVILLPSLSSSLTPSLLPLSFSPPPSFQVGDVILEIDGCTVGSDGSVAVLKDCDLGTTHQLKLSFLFSRRRHDDEVTLKLLRKNDVSLKREQKRRKLKGEDSKDGKASKDHDLKAGDDVLHTPPVLWRWEEQVNQVPHRVTILRVNEVDGSAADNSSATREGSASKGEDGGAADAGVRTFDVLDRVTDTVTKCVLAVHLSSLDPWSATVPERKEVSVTLKVQTFPVLRSVRQHQEGATLSYFMVRSVCVSLTA
jgi:S1-C subfamily serine protease